MTKKSDDKINSEKGDDQDWLRQLVFNSTFEHMLIKDNNVFDDMSPIEVEYRVVHEWNIISALQAKQEREDEGYSPFTIDHMPDLLTMARSFKKKNKYDLTILFFSTYFEHKINDILFRLLIGRQKPEGVIKKVLRQNWEDKCTWILDLLNVDQIEEEYRKKLKHISDMRNSYIHYKWSSSQDDKSNIEESIVNAEKLVRYLNSYEEKTIYSNKRKKILKMLDLKRAFDSYSELIKLPSVENNLGEQLKRELINLSETFDEKSKLFLDEINKKKFEA